MLDPDTGKVYKVKIRLTDRRQPEYARRHRTEPDGELCRQAHRG
ncbi:MAG: DUF2147 domain-containing protein [Gemmatimonas sp.]